MIPRLLAEVLLQVVRVETISVLCEDGVTHDAECWLVEFRVPLIVEQRVTGVEETSSVGVRFFQHDVIAITYPVVEIVAVLLYLIEVQSFQSIAEKEYIGLFISWLKAPQNR